MSDEGQTLESKAIDKLALEYGGKEGLAELLLHAESPPPGTPLDKVLALILDPANEGKSLGLLCRQAGVSMNTVMKAVQAGHGAKAVRQGLSAMYEKVEAVAADTVARAVPQWVSCVTCQGKGSTLVNDLPVDCKPCFGRGLVEVVPELARQKFVLEVAGVYKKAHVGGTKVTVPVTVSQSVKVRQDATATFDLVKAAAMKTIYSVEEPRQVGPGQVKELPAPVEVIDLKPSQPMPAMARPAWKRP